MSSFKTRCPSCKGLNRVPSARIAETPKCGKCQTALLDGAAIEGTADNFATLINSKLPVVVDFWAPWCNPCLGFAPVFASVASERVGAVRCLKVDTESEQALGAQYGIRSIPTIMVFKEGKVLDTLNGALPKSQFDQWLNQVIN
ncbi:thioredoxin TrxC [Vibrio ezurae]|uniref:Thioredoxin n=1 Tax=Vibrio ezurae NBRC 102218 TaxID=1219080 RepID=U3B1V7_9VIBR|nr:thioredoxin TrxC [Vibrio ezurae]GAD79427.1 thioredoxin 2 [Vibrio ezurae NBRC 102218]